MKITINGQTKTIDTPLNIGAILEGEGYANKIVAVAVNGQFVPKAQYLVTHVNDDDEIEIVSPMQGG